MCQEQKSAGTLSENLLFLLYSTYLLNQFVESVLHHYSQVCYRSGHFIQGHAAPYQQQSPCYTSNAKTSPFYCNWIWDLRESLRFQAALEVGVLTTGLPGMFPSRHFYNSDFFLIIPNLCHFIIDVY